MKRFSSGERSRTAVGSTTLLATTRCGLCSAAGVQRGASLTLREPDAARGSVTEQSMDRSWTAFVYRWNTEGLEAFQQKLVQREEQHSRLSVGALAVQICELSWDADRTCCFASPRMSELSRVSCTATQSRYLGAHYKRHPLF
ncbi:hypothetical protein P3T76_005455 [Phytophthora citrophthora]|uniref:Uncharacterized protein n=1 Tax=Phytophthora citrophthora TaxID=4793 RepID=A0AAD9LMM7_9STRA|nr:hypothetical protein P3T76_005455 [Phytophthora citrophthora]